MGKKRKRNNKRVNPPEIRRLFYQIFIDSSGLDPLKLESSPDNPLECYVISLI